MKRLMCILAIVAMSFGATTLSSGAEALSGSDLYKFYCSACHGLNAKGSGPMAPILLVQPTDLTELASQNEGEFPRLRVISRIDGRDPLVAHGSDMPVFGPWFESDNMAAIQLDSENSTITSQPVIDLLLYLERIQN